MSAVSVFWFETLEISGYLPDSTGYISTTSPSFNMLSALRMPPSLSIIIISDRGIDRCYSRPCTFISSGISITAVSLPDGS